MPVYVQGLRLSLVCLPLVADRFLFVIFSCFGGKVEIRKVTFTFKVREHLRISIHNEQKFERAPKNISDKLIKFLIR